MKISTIINLATYGELNQLSIKNNTEIILSFMYLGLIELYKRFNIGIKTETFTSTTTTSVYNLRNTDINQILTIYDSNKKELISKLVQCDTDYDYSQINFNTILLTNPKDELLTVVYKASPPEIDETTETIELPDDMLEALLHYIGFKAHSAVNGNKNSENDNHYLKFERSCALLDSMGYAVDIYTARPSIQSKGLV